MNNFIEIPANKRSISQRRLKFGIGVNDSPYLVKQRVNSKQLICPFYLKWSHMLKRCYSIKYQEIRPTYKNCTVCPEWFKFMTFREWMIKQEWQGLHIDKDILYPGNKLYSPTTCCFVSLAINSLLTNHALDRGKYPQGVNWSKWHKKFQAKISINSKSKHLGYFNTIEEAELVYKIAKKKYIIKLAQTQAPRIKAGLLLHAELIKIPMSFL